MVSPALNWRRRIRLLARAERLLALTTKRFAWFIPVLAFAIGMACAARSTNNVTPGPSNTTASTRGPLVAEKTPSGTTTILHYIPSVQPGGSASGDCFTRSVAAPWRADSWRCTSGNAIYDPCFAVAGGSVACGMNPAASEAGFALRLSRPVPAVTAPTASPSAVIPAGWLLLLSGGATCQPDTGATGVIEGKRANYTCSDGRWVLGELTPGRIWTADVVRVQSGSLTPVAREQVAVAQVWQ